MLTTSISRRHVLALSAAAMTPLAHSQSADGPLRLIVPFTPGTGIDLIARQISPHLSRRLGRPVVVENKAGASGNIGTMEVVRAAPDGSTLLVTVNTLVMNRALYPTAGFDPIRQLEPISLTSWGTLVLVASTKSGITNAKDLIARAKAKPGALNYGSPGAGTPHHLSMELVKNKSGTFLTHVPYRGTAPAVTDLLSGVIDVMFLPIHVALQHVKAGTLRALAISSEKPHPLMPEVPTLKVLGLGEINVDMWYGVMAPAGTPKPILDRLNTELKEILALPEVNTAFQTQGMDPAHSTPARFRELMVKDADRWAALIRTQKITVD